ncbi:MAG TPA: hypothetical protein PLE26_02580 [Candidatus Paceibacterota bacterium]|jgi:hypothetical protein|nr:hypothetical protein [Candidatus Paceibacterota bacterium]
MTDSRKERKEDMTDHWWNIHTKICSLKAETENEKEKEILDKIQIFLIKEIQKITQNKKKDDPYRSR